MSELPGRQAWCNPPSLLNLQIRKLRPREGPGVYLCPYLIFGCPDSKKNSFHFPLPSSKRFTLARNTGSSFHTEAALRELIQGHTSESVFSLLLIVLTLIQNCTAESLLDTPDSNSEWLPYFKNKSAQKLHIATFAGFGKIFCSPIALKFPNKGCQSSAEQCQHQWVGRHLETPQEVQQSLIGAFWYMGHKSATLAATQEGKLPSEKRLPSWGDTHSYHLNATPAPDHHQHMSGGDVERVIMEKLWKLLPYSLLPSGSWLLKLFPVPGRWSHKRKEPGQNQFTLTWMRNKLFSVKSLKCGDFFFFGYYS